MWLVFAIYIMVVAISIVYACIKLSEPGISNEVRRLVLSRHIITMVTFVFLNIYSMVGMCIALMPRWHGSVPQIDGPGWRIMKVMLQA